VDTGGRAVSTIPVAHLHKSEVKDSGLTPIGSNDLDTLSPPALSKLRPQNQRNSREVVRAARDRHKLPYANTARAFLAGMNAHHISLQAVAGVSSTTEYSNSSLQHYR
jgi:hypothetical protein